MKVLRFLLFPVGIIYWLVTYVRNLFYDKGIFDSYVAPIPVIAVGNLSVGGTGKSPQIEYLIRLLSDKYQVATLSRGYKRKSKGFVLADENTKVQDLGDEPYQFYSKFKNIYVAVDSDRKSGIKRLLQLKNKPDLILLDDAYQHRKVKASLYVMLSSFSDLYFNDFILPVGNLRESKIGASRAKIIVITKCPMDLSEEMMQQVILKIQPNSDQKVFFSYIEYDDYVFSISDKIKVDEIKDQHKTCIAGIANPISFFEYITNVNDLKLSYSDHHNFSDAEIQEIKQKSKDKLIVTTEKDYVRISDKFDENQLYYLPIKTNFFKDSNLFDQIILESIEDLKFNI